MPIEVGLWRLGKRRNGHLACFRKNAQLTPASQSSPVFQMKRGDHGGRSPRASVPTGPQDLWAPHGNPRCRQYIGEFNGAESCVVC